MPFCPQCKAEYQQDITICSDCQIELMPELPPEDTVEYVDWEIVQSVPSEVVGTMIKGVLETENIDVVLHSHELVALGGIREDWSKPEWGDLLVHGDDFEDAKAIIEEYLASLPKNQIENEDADIETV